MNNMTELNAELAATFKELKAGTIDAKQAFELANLAGKMIGIAKVQLAYAVIKRDENPDIPFLETGKPAIEGEKS